MSKIIGSTVAIGDATMWIDDRWQGKAEDARPRGKRYRAWRKIGREQIGPYFATEGEAQRQIDQWAAQANAGNSEARPVVNRNMTVAGFFYSVWWPHHAERVSDKIKRERLSDWERHILPTIGDTPLAELNEFQLQRMVSNWDFAASTTNVMVRATIAQFLQTAINKGLHPGPNYFRTGDVKLPVDDLDERAPDHVMTDSEVDRIVNSLEPRFQAMGWLAASTGMRAGELRGLRWRDVTIREDRVIIRVLWQLGTKGDGRRRVVTEPGFKRPKGWNPRKPRPLVFAPAWMGPILEEHRRRFPGNFGLVFTNYKGNPMSQQIPVTEWLRALDRAGIDPESDGVQFRGWHMMRHYYAASQLAAGVAPKAVANQLGHASVRTTFRYYEHFIPDDGAADHALAVASERRPALRGA